MAGIWKFGRGALGKLQPLLGAWKSAPGDERPPSKTPCTRRFDMFGKSYVRLEADWAYGGGAGYREIALFGKNEAGELAFWSFTNDGKKSNGVTCDGADVHPAAIAFLAHMPAGAARMIYWPLGDEPGFRFAVESRTKKGWNRFFEHIYRPAS